MDPGRVPLGVLEVRIRLKSEKGIQLDVLEKGNLELATISLHESQA